MANILVSGCLLGNECRYKGDSCKNERVCALAEKHTLIAVCPEQMGGLETPRNPSERVGDQREGCDCAVSERCGDRTVSGQAEPCFLCGIQGKQSFLRQRHDL